MNSQRCCSGSVWDGGRVASGVDVPTRAREDEQLRLTVAKGDTDRSLYVRAVVLRRGIPLHLPVHAVFQYRLPSAVKC